MTEVIGLSLPTPMREDQMVTHSLLGQSNTLIGRPLMVISPVLGRLSTCAFLLMCTMNSVSSLPSCS